MCGGECLTFGTCTQHRTPMRHELTVLEQCCLTLDRAERLRHQIEATGEQIALPSGSVKANPLVAAELSARNLVVRLLAKLGVLDTGAEARAGSAAALEDLRRS
jgi:hypothetical protein